MRGFRRFVMAIAAASMVTAGAALPAGGQEPSAALVCGGLIAYTERTAGAISNHLMVVPANGGTPRLLWDRPDDAQGELDAAWSPDGHAIAFAGRRADDTGFPVDNRLYVLRVGAAEPDLLVDQQGVRGGLRTPTWSPDGTRIAYATAAGPTGQAYRGLAWIRVVDLATRENTLITGVPEGSAVPDLAWSPRGDQLLVSGFNTATGWTVYSVRPDPADPRLTALISEEAGSPATGFPAFLPGGRAVLVEQDNAEGTLSRLYLTDPKFRYLVPRTPGPGWESQPDFGASPLRAVYQQFNDARTETSINVLNLATGTSHPLVPAKAGIYVEQPDWQPVLGCRPWPIPGT